MMVMASTISPERTICRTSTTLLLVLLPRCRPFRFAIGLSLGLTPLRG